MGWWRRAGVLVLGWTVAAPCLATTWYVSAGGDDGATGRDAHHALRTPAAGLAKLHPGDTLLLAGLHALSEPLVIGPELSGTAEQPTRIGALTGSAAGLSGAVELTGFEPQGDGLYRVAWRGSPPAMVVQYGERLILARYPNWDADQPFTSGWAYAAPADPAAPEPKRTLRLKPGDWRRWAEPSRGRVSIFSGHEWWNNLVPIDSYDAESGVVHLAEDCSYEIGAEDRFFVEGLPEELDAPGEWCLDPDGRYLLFRPDQQAGLDEMRAVQTPTLLRLEGARNVEISGLDLAECAATAVVLSNCVGCRVTACEVRAVGGYGGSGIAVYGGHDNRVDGCVIADIGSHGIALSGGDPVSRTAGRNRADNNDISDVGRVYKQGAGISLSGAGNVASQNSIRLVPRWGIVFGGPDHLIECNELADTSQETTDTGAIYGGSLNWLSAHGTVIRGNVIDRPIGRGRRNGEWWSPFYAWGIYLDWSAMGVTVEGNVIRDAPRAGIMVHDGRYNSVRNNLILDCGGGEHDQGSQIECSGWHTEHFFWLRGLGFGWVKQFESVADQPAWHTPDSTLHDPRQSALPDGRTMHDNRIERNLMVWTHPRAKAIWYRNVDYAANPSDRNLLWHPGQPLLTGIRRIEAVSGPNRIPNPELRTADGAELPAHWSARIPWEGCRATPEDGAIKLVGRSSPTLAGRPDWERQVAVQTDMIGGLTPGGDYALTVHLRAAEPATRARVEALAYKGGAWDVRFSEEVSVGVAGAPYQVVFRLPQPGDPNWHDGLLDTFYVRVILRQDDGELWLSAPSLRAATWQDEWAAWQAKGQDRHSLVADPMLDHRPGPHYLEPLPQSPAWALGWQSIDWEQVGCAARRAGG